MRSPTQLFGYLSLLAGLPLAGLAMEYTVSSAAEVSALSPVAGDTLILESGQWINQRLYLNFNGTAGNPIIVRAAIPGKTVFLGTSSIEINGDYIEVSGVVFAGESSTKNTAVTFTANSSNSRLHDTAIVGFNPTAQSSIHSWVNIYGTDNRVDHCLLQGKVHAGQTLRIRRVADQADRHLIDHNYFLDRVPLGVNGGETIQIGLSQTQYADSLTTVEHNLFENLDGEIEIISVKSGGNTLRYNTVVDCAGLFTLRHGNGSTIEGNFFFCNQKSGAGGVRIYGKDHRIVNNYIYGAEGTSKTRGGISIHSGDLLPPEENPSGAQAAENCLIAFNTLVDCDRSFNYGNGHVVPPEAITLANNIVSTTAAAIIYVNEDIINPIYEGNLFFGPSLGIPVPAGITLVDPLLVAGSDSVFRPTAGSPAIDASVGTYATIVSDIDGQPRVDGFKDVGADELSLDSPTNAPLTSADVGPSWASYPFVVDTLPGIEEVSLDDGRLNTAYTFTLHSFGGNEPLVWSIQSGILPAGLVLSESGTISGIPTALGYETFTVAVVDADGDSDIQTLTLTITEPFPHYGAFIESGGSVTIEAEHFSESIPLLGKEWTPVFNSGATGTDALNAIQALPNNSGIVSIENGVLVDYNVDISLGGTYYIHVLGAGPNSSSNSLFVSVNQSMNQAQVIHLPEVDFSWARATTPFNLVAGSHRISIWMREAGSIVDRILLTTSATSPTGPGDAESSRHLDIFPVWRASYFGDATPGYDDDSDKDGLSLLVEYALGSDPQSGVHAGKIPILISMDSSLRYSFPRNPNLADVIYRVNSGTNPSQLTTTLYDSSLDASPNNAGERMEIVTLPLESGSLFLVLEVSIKAL
ncbi:hypothetical protein G0Q06_13150 [Puniceicoccales bacterium CK1056]|uniref:Gylcosyl hydrolase 115 C-terminal domain-containing protein n=1 Tax=Oceanipulchritudo coccoides TaxID=2706888 RepID=A0A6B2M4X1_9BACT|nr:chondroitinase-B domain-containing protein [Oceanipulchritudo coccoides]NDV63406.1 hypothetical protein [Oceanipulchritudo coccoides]